MLSERLHQRQVDALRDTRTTLDVFLVQESLRLYRYAQKSGTPGEVAYQRRGVRDAIGQLRARRQEVATPRPTPHVLFPAA